MPKQNILTSSKCSPVPFSQNTVAIFKANPRIPSALPKHSGFAEFHADGAMFVQPRRFTEGQRGREGIEIRCGESERQKSGVQPLVGCQEDGEEEERS